MIVPNYLGYGEIGERAESFINRHHPSRELPIPIEKIIEFQLGLDIVPHPNLYLNFRINGFLTSDRTAIFVDERQFSQYWEKYRFTLAHEVGHYVLHEKAFGEVVWSGVDEYKDFIMSMDKEALDRFEIQGNYFAEQVLVPESSLIEVATAVAGRHRDELRRIGAETRILLPYISKEIALPFEVSPQVVECRINRMEKEIDLLEL